MLPEMAATSRTFASSSTLSDIPAPTYMQVETAEVCDCIGIACTDAMAITGMLHPPQHPQHQYA